MKSLITQLEPSTTQAYTTTQAQHKGITTSNLKPPHLDKK
jgi:hypothetical protein